MAFLRLKNFLQNYVFCNVTKLKNSGLPLVLFCDTPPKCWHLVAQMICRLSGNRPQYSSCTASWTVATSMHSKIHFATTVSSKTENQIYI